MKLFAIYIGGEHPSANIEIHDVRFVVANTIRETYDRLRADWWGTPGTLHVDCWAEIDHVDGYAVTLKPERSAAREKLWFVNLGGYDGKEFAEQHKNMFVIATSATEAKAKALRSIEGWTDAHRDDLFEAEKAFALDELVGERLYVHLTPGQDIRPPRFTCRYTPLK
jgi:LmbE family N-acetylglucosaminyl deacetylase